MSSFNKPVSSASIIDGSVVNADVATGAAIDAAKLADGSVSNAELQRLDGVTSAIQTQLDLKAPLAAPTFTGAAVLNDGQASGGTVTIKAQNNATGVHFDPTVLSGQGGLGIGQAASDKLNVFVNDGNARFCIFQNQSVAGYAIWRLRTTLSTETADFGIGGSATGGDFQSYAYLYSNIGLNGFRFFTSGVKAVTIDNTQGVTFHGAITTPLTASRALATGASGELAVSAVTSTELGYVSGVTSAIQTQFTGKAATGAVTASGLTQTTARLLGRTTAATGAIEEISAGTGVTLSAGSISIGQAVATSSNPTFATVNMSSASDVVPLFTLTSGSALIIRPQAATSGTQTMNSPAVYWRGRYWNGSSSTDLDFLIQGIVSATTPAGYLDFQFNGTSGLKLTSAGSLVQGSAALATNATDGFFYAESCAGIPTGTPTTFTGRVPLVYDSTNNKLYVYNGAWKSVTLA